MKQTVSETDALLALPMYVESDLRLSFFQSDEKKESSSASEKKRVVSKQKKNSETGIWPCKINGCNKEFAREADLKRHQRTTKLHSQPGSNV
jgi:uncharacterized Zn-finger protein